MFASDRSPLHTATISSNLKATSVLWRNEVSDKDIEKGTEKKNSRDSPDTWFRCKTGTLICRLQKQFWELCLIHTGILDASLEHT